MIDVFCIGSAHVDNIRTFIKDPIMGNSNHADTKIYIGGVAYNMALVLKALGCTVGLSSILGQDGDGHNVLSYIQKNKYDATAIIKSSDQHTASYNAFHLTSGDLCLAAADMHIYHTLTPADLLTQVNKLKTARSWMVDSTYLPHIQEFLKSQASGIDVYVTICSVSEAKHVTPWLSSANVLFANFAEIAVLTDMQVTSATNIWPALSLIAKNGIKTIMATNGADGVYVYNNGKQLHFPAYPAEVKCVNGAGDSFAAAVIYNLTQKRPLVDAVKAGLAAAALRLEGKEINATNIQEISHPRKRARIAPQ